MMCIILFIIITMCTFMYIFICVILYRLCVGHMCTMFRSHVNQVCVDHLHMSVCRSCADNVKIT